MINEEEKFKCQVTLFINKQQIDEMDLYVRKLQMYSTRAHLMRCALVRELRLAKERLDGDDVLKRKVDKEGLRKFKPYEQ